ncbi:hypothetical protein HK104_007156 [Borealophlyctis nickersoniae]|nr:hypothetical protein HK104_007156 [Borealophlyctis nickersoniae]
MGDKLAKADSERRQTFVPPPRSTQNTDDDAEEEERVATHRALALAQEKIELLLEEQRESEKRRGEAEERVKVLTGQVDDMKEKIRRIVKKV